MILVGNQRGGAKDLALHLLKEENDHVQVHELRSFASDNLTSALNETYAISRGTRCKQFLYSMSLNPPPDEQVSTEAFKDAIDRAEERLGLTGQPRAVVFHEKEGRRHAHCVWSRIKADEMKAVHMSKDREKLMDVSRDLFREHGWKMPRGMMKSAERDPLNFSLEEWQQAKRVKAGPREVKMAIKECWAVSDSRAAFENALESRGFKLARGDRRGFVAVDMNGEPFAISRWAEIKTKDIRARLGELEPDYPGVEDRKQEFAQEIGTRLRNLRKEESRKAEEERQRAESERRALIQSQAQERAKQALSIKARWDHESADRQARFNRGWRALVDQFSGRVKRIREQNMEEAYRCMLRDREEKDALIFSHLEERRELAARYKAQQRQRNERRAELGSDISRYPAKDHSSSKSPKNQFQHASRAPPGPERRSGDHDADRMVKREAFLTRRTAQARYRGPRHDLDR